MVVEDNILNKTANIYTARLSQKEFQKLSTYIYNELGIKMPDTKKVMLESRLQRRLKELNMASFSDYCEFVFSKAGQQVELFHMIDVVTTNKTDFFREPQHFEFLINHVLPDYRLKSKTKPLSIWSAGCSSGEEPYTLAMVLSDAVENGLIDDFSIFATDISIRVLQKAAMAIYPENRITDIPLSSKKKYLLKAKDPLDKTVRFIPRIRNKISFHRLNFMDEYYDIQNMFDIVFCRNVIIYFDKETQEQVINKLSSKLKTGGYFFFGHSESITNMNVPLENIKPTIFRKI